MGFWWLATTGAFGIFGFAYDASKGTEAPVGMKIFFLLVIALCFVAAYRLRIPFSEKEEPSPIARRPIVRRPDLKD